MDFDAESEAVELLESQGFDPAAPPPPLYLACAVMSARRVICSPFLSGRARWVEATDRLYWRPTGNRVAENYCTAHELAERTLGRLGFSDEQIEVYCDRLAAAILAPAPAVRAAVKALGRHLPLLADALGITQSVAALRLGEVTGSPIALVTPRTVRVRGDPWGWPEIPEEIRALVPCPPPELRLVLVTDAPRRIVLEAA